jgi:hypothetical protein
MKRVPLLAVLLALHLVQGCGESSDSTANRHAANDIDGKAQNHPAPEHRETTLTKIRLMEDTMGGNEVEASNGFMKLRVRGLYQRMFSGDYYMGIKVKPLLDITVSKIICSSLTGRNVPLREHETRFQPPAGEFRRLVEREIDVPFVPPAASMLLTFYDQQGDVLSKFEITHIVDHMIGVGILPAANREVYLNSEE